MIIVFWNLKKQNIEIHYNSKVITVQYKKSIFLHKHKFYFNNFKSAENNKLIETILTTGKRIYKLKKNNCRTMISGKQVEYRYIY